jgi:hypothetical protein
MLEQMVLHLGTAAQLRPESHGRSNRTRTSPEWVSDRTRSIDECDRLSGASTDRFGPGSTDSESVDPSRQASAREHPIESESNARPCFQPVFFVIKIIFMYVTSQQATELACVVLLELPGVATRVPHMCVVQL